MQYYEVLVSAFILIFLRFLTICVFVVLDFLLAVPCHSDFNLPDTGPESKSNPLAIHDREGLTSFIGGIPVHMDLAS